MQSSPASPSAARGSGGVLTALLLLASLLSPSPAKAGHTPPPASVTIAGSLQSEVGCPGDWDPGCALTHLSPDPDDGVWQGVFSIPAGAHEYKAALNDAWDENYGLNATQDGANIPLSLSEATDVKFYYDHQTHWVTDNQGWVIATAPGSFQTELGCPFDWDPTCLRSWLQDPDGDGIYGFTTAGLPAGAYEVKVTIDERWDENYGEGGVFDGPNIHFTVPADNAPVTFRYDPVSHILQVSSGHGHDDNVEYFGLGHDSQDSLYRTPFGAITPGTTLRLRFRTYHGDVQRVRARVFDTALGRERIQEMAVAASDVSCYDPAQPTETCDLWETTLTPTGPTTLYYRFIVTDGTATAYYADDPMFDGGPGQATPGVVDNGYAVTVYDPSFRPLEWLKDGVVYQIFPDRFRNADPTNDPDPSEPRYGYPPEGLDQIVNKQWGDLPEGHCRFYENPDPPCAEGPRGRDYFGGDLRGVTEKLSDLQRLGVSVLYLNPIFEAASNHLYDTQDYYTVDHFFGSTAEDFAALVGQADALGIRIVLDGVFNHVSSDSRYFDRYHHFTAVGACESVDSPFRSWFSFQPQAGGPCAGPDGPNTTTYTGWFGFDSLPVLDKTNPQVRRLVYEANRAVARHWLRRGADGWRLDVMGDPSFPEGFWEEFRTAVKETDPDAAIIGELWKKHEVLPKVHGDEADTSMNYRFRNAILGFFGTVDDKGFPDDGQTDQPPSVFARKLVSVREDNPDASYYTMLNLMGSHDTMRILWNLTPGEDNRQDKEFDPQNLALGRRLLRLATVVQMTVPGAPTIYYGDEVGLTGDDDPDDRRTYPWPDAGGAPDRDLLAHYANLIAVRKADPVFRDGALTFLLTDDQERTMAYLLRTEDRGAVVAVNRSGVRRTLRVPLDGRLPAAVEMRDALGTVGTVTAANGVLTFELPPLAAAILVPTAGQDLSPPAAPAGLVAVGGNGQVEVGWAPVPGAAGYRLYRSPVTGGGHEPVASVTATGYRDTGVTNGKRYFYVARAVDAAGNEGDASPEDVATPAYPIRATLLHDPKDLTHQLSVDPTPPILGRVAVPGVTDAGGDPGEVLAQVGYGPAGSDPGAWTTWAPMSHDPACACGPAYQYAGTLRPERTGAFDLLVRFSTDGGQTWSYGDRDGGYGAEPGTDAPGALEVTPNPDTVPPARPRNLRVTDWGADFVSVAWDPVADAAEYWLYRATGGTLSAEPIAKLPAPTTSYTDTPLATGETYAYAVRAVDQALNRSRPSAPVRQTAEPKTVQVTFRVGVPDETPPTDAVYIPGSIDILGPWDPARQPMVPVGEDVWEVTLEIADGTLLEYKYTRGSWERVEWWGSIVGLTNRSVTISYGTDGTQLVDDTATDWGSGDDTHKAVQFWRDPLVESTSPADGSSGPAPSAVTVAFSRAVQPLAGGDFGGSVTVERNAAEVAGTVTSPTGETLVWTPASPLQPGTYTVTVFHVMSDIGDNVPMQQPYVFTFTVT